MRIEDALHGYIQLEDEEKQIIDSSQIQRLRRIRQLGMSSLVYPSATHTRFQHSLGVMELAGRFADSLSLDDKRRKEIRLASLMHDTGHGPFSHISETVAEQHGYSHEDFSCKIIDKLDSLHTADSDRIKKIIQGELEIGQIVAGDIDADRMDYLMRDSHNSGIEYGEIDADTIVRLAEIDSRRLVFDYKAVPALEALFTSRFHMIKTLYRHHTAVIAEKMVQRSLEDLVENHLSVEEMMKLDDYQAHNKMMNAGGKTTEIYSKVSDRDLYKRAVVWDIDDISKEGLQALEKRIDNPEEIEREIAEAVSVKPSEVIVDTPVTPKISELDVKVKKDGDIKQFKDVSPMTKSLRDAEWRTVSLKVYTPEKHVESIKEEAESVLKSYQNVLGQYLD